MGLTNRVNRQGKVDLDITSQTEFYRLDGISENSQTSDSIEQMNENKLLEGDIAMAFNFPTVLPQNDFRVNEHDYTKVVTVPIANAYTDEMVKFTMGTYGAHWKYGQNNRGNPRHPSGEFFFKVLNLAYPSKSSPYYKMNGRNKSTVKFVMETELMEYYFHFKKVLLSLETEKEFINYMNQERQVGSMEPKKKSSELWDKELVKKTLKSERTKWARKNKHLRMDTFLETLVKDKNLHILKLSNYKLDPLTERENAWAKLLWSFKETINIPSLFVYPASHKKVVYFTGIVNSIVRDETNYLGRDNGKIDNVNVRRVGIRTHYPITGCHKDGTMVCSYTVMKQNGPPHVLFRSKIEDSADWFYTKILAGGLMRESKAKQFRDRYSSSGKLGKQQLRDKIAIWMNDKFHLDLVLSNDKNSILRKTSREKHEHIKSIKSSDFKGKTFNTNPFDALLLKLHPQTHAWVGRGDTAKHLKNFIRYIRISRSDVDKESPRYNQFTRSINVNYANPINDRDARNIVLDLKKLYRFLYFRSYDFVCDVVEFHWQRDYHQTFNLETERFHPDREGLARYVFTQQISKTLIETYFKKKSGETIDIRCFENDYNKEYEHEIKTQVYGPLMNRSILENLNKPHILFNELDQFQSSYIKKALALSKKEGTQTWADFEEDLEEAFVDRFPRSASKFETLEALDLMDPFDALRSFYDCVDTYIYLCVRNKGKGHFQFMDTRGNTKSDLELYSIQRVIPDVPYNDTIDDEDEFNDSKKRENYFLTVKKAMTKIHVDRKVLIPVIIMKPN